MMSIKTIVCGMRMKDDNKLRLYQLITMGESKYEGKKMYSDRMLMRLWENKKRKVGLTSPPKFDTM